MARAPAVVEQRVAVLVGHADVAQQDVGRTPFDDAPRLGHARHGRDPRAILRERRLQQRAGVCLIVHDQHVQAIRRRTSSVEAGSAVERRVVRDLARRTPSTTEGRRTSKVAPAPRPALRASMVPPCSSTSCFAIASPRPRPPCSRVIVAVSLAERLEDERQERRVDAGAGVADDQRDSRRRARAEPRPARPAA